MCVILHEELPIPEISFHGDVHAAVVQAEAKEILLVVFVVKAVAIRLLVECEVEQSILGKDFTGVASIPLKVCWTISPSTDVSIVVTTVNKGPIYSSGSPGITCINVLYRSLVRLCSGSLHLYLFRIGVVFVPVAFGRR